MQRKFSEDYIFGVAKIVIMWLTLVFSIIILIISFVFLAIKMLFSKKGTFPKTHVSQNKALRDRGITCVQTQDFEERNREGLYGKNNHTPRR